MKNSQPTKNTQPPPKADKPKEPAPPKPDANLMSEGEPPAAPPQDDEALIRAKMAAGLSRKQAEQVLASQRAIDAAR